MTDCYINKDTFNIRKKACDSCCCPEKCVNMVNYLISVQVDVNVAQMLWILLVCFCFIIMYWWMAQHFNSLKIKTTLAKHESY